MAKHTSRYIHQTKPNLRPSMKATLEGHGIDPDRYLSLRIDKGDLPDGAEIVIQVRDKETSELRAVDLHDPDQRRAFAQNSQFYGKIMADGHVFNPYIHRRFIAAQFRQLIRRYGTSGVHKGVMETYNWSYAIYFIRKEVHKLNNLYRFDREAYAERSRFFTIERIADIIYDYACTAQEYLDSLSKGKHREENVYVADCGVIKFENLRPMKHRFTTLAERARGCKTYAQLDVLFDAFEWLKLPKHVRTHRVFANPFIESGAYYTLKHAIMFEGVTLPCLDQARSLAKLKAQKDGFLANYSCTL